MTMHLIITILALLVPNILAAKEVIGEEIPANDASMLLKDEPVEENAVVKRSISEIAARRRSALDKSFMRFGRSDPELNEPRVKLSKGNLMRFGRSGQNDFLRLERGRPQDFMRFGRAANLMRFGRGGNNMMRFGRGGNNMMRFGRGGNNMMRFGRGGNNMMRFGRGGNNMMRFGRGGNNMMRFGRGGNNMMRFGRSDSDFLNFLNENGLDVDEELDNDMDITPTSNDYVRVERSSNIDKKPKASNYANKLNDNFMRLGRSLENNYDDNEYEINPGREDHLPILPIDNDSNRIEKTGVYQDDGFLNSRHDTLSDSSEQNPLDIIFPEEMRRKRSLLKTDTNKNVHTSQTPTVAADIVDRSIS